MFGSYKVVHLVGGQLIVEADGGKFYFSPFFLFGLVSAVFFVYRAYKSRTLFPLTGIFLWALPWALIGLFSSRSGSLLLDRSTDTAVFRQPSYFWHHTSKVPMHEFQYAERRYTRNATWIAVVFDDGGAATFADSTDSPGQGQAIQAINDYLGVSRRRF